MILRSQMQWAGGLAVAAAVLVNPSVAHADAGIAMMPVQQPAAFLFLLPVILIEALYLQTALCARWRRTLIAVAGTNLCTAALGYPMAWAMAAGVDQLGALPGSAAELPGHMGWVPLRLCEWLYPQWPGAREQILPVLVIFVVLLVPSFVISGVLKSWMLDWYDLLQGRGEVRRESWTATRLSYLFLASAGCVLLYLASRGT